jgi:hypothetical protein
MTSGKLDSMEYLGAQEKHLRSIPQSTYKQVEQGWINEAHLGFHIIKPRIVTPAMT